MAEDEETTASGGSRELNPVFDYFISKMRPIRGFIRTRRGVRAGDQVWDYTKERLTENGLLGPWSFNIQETILAAAPTIAVLKVLEFLYPQASEIGDLDADVLELISVAQGVESTVYPLIFPTLITITAFTAAWASLHKSESSRVARRRARNAYLYLDGAHGLLIEASVVLVITFGFLLADAINMIAVVLLFYAAYLIFAMITYWRIPRLLFQVNGYSPDPPRRGTPTTGRPGPWRKYDYTVFLTPVLIFPFVYIAFHEVVLLISHAFIWARHLVVDS